MVTLSKDLTEQRSNYGKIWEKNILGRGNCKCKGPEGAAVWGRMKDTVARVE